PALPGTSGAWLAGVPEMVGQLEKVYGARGPLRPPGGYLVPGRPAPVPGLPARRLGRGPGQGGLRILVEHGPQRIAPLADPVTEPGLARPGRQPPPGQDDATA